MRLTACVGVDPFEGDETQFRKTYAVRTEGASARFITVLEPYEREPVIAQAQPVSDQAVKILRRDGTVDEISLSGASVHWRSTAPDGAVLTETAKEERQE